MEDTSGRRYVIVGNGIAGTTAAEHIRKADAAASIILLTNEPHSLYNRIALPPFLKNKITQQKVMIKSVPWHEERRIDLRREVTATRVDPKAQEVYLSTGGALPYDVLLIATGGRPNPHPVARGLENIFHFQTLDDALAITAQIERSTHAVVVGGSYISYELTEAFRVRGLHTTWLMRGPRFLRRVLDEEGGALVDQIAESHGVQMVHGREVIEVRDQNGKVREVIADNGQVFPAEMMGIGVGITRNVGFLADSGIETRQGVITNEFLQTNLPNVFAAGDAAECYDTYIGQHILMGSWDNATNHGKVVAQNMLGNPTPYVDVPTYSTTLFDSRIMAFGGTPEVSEGLEAAMWIDHHGRNYRRLFFRGEHLLGGVIIGQRKGFPKYLDLIQKRTPIPKEDREKLLTIT